MDEHMVVSRTSVVEWDVKPIDALTRWARCIPHLLLTAAAGAGGIVAAFVAGAVVVATGRRPMGITRFQVWSARERVRCFSYFFLLRPDRPRVPAMTLVDEGDDPHTEVTSVPSPRLPRWSPPARLAIGFPSIAVGLLIGITLDVLYPVAIVVAAVRGGWPAGYRRYLAAVEEWVGTVLLYMHLATDERPQLLPPLPWQPIPQPVAAPALGT